MTATLRQGQAIDDLMERASQLLQNTEYFECERTAMKALDRAWALRDFERMARICLPLQECRRQRRLVALDAGRAAVLTSFSGSAGSVAAGCYLLEPPLLGIDGHSFREQANRRQVPVVVLVREPLTRKGTWPIVGVGTGPSTPISIRVYVEPVTGTPTPEWFARTGEALGDAAIAKLDARMPAAWRVDDLLHYLDAVPDHEKLHQRLADECRLAATQPAAPPRRRGIDDPYSF